MSIEHRVIRGFMQLQSGTYRDINDLCRCRVSVKQKEMSDFVSLRVSLEIRAKKVIRVGLE